MGEHAEPLRHGGMEQERCCAWGYVDGTTWPVPVGAEWLLRYGTPEQIVGWRMSLASIVSAYSALVDPTCSHADAVARLRRARAVARSQKAFS